MTTTDCPVKGCTNNTHGRTYCGTHRDQKRKGFTPGQAPSRYVAAGTIRPLLLDLKGNHNMAELGRMLRCSPRTLTRALQSDTVTITRTLADNIRFASGEHFEPVEPIYRDKTGISGPEAAEYAKTPEGQAFIARCRGARKRRQEVAA